MGRRKTIRDKANRLKPVRNTIFKGEVRFGGSQYNTGDIDTLTIYDRAEYEAAEEEPFTAPVTVKFSDSQKAMLKAFCDKEKVDMSAMLRDAVDFYLSFHPHQVQMMAVSQALLGFLHGIAAARR